MGGEVDLPTSRGEAHRATVWVDCVKTHLDRVQKIGNLGVYSRLPPGEVLATLNKVQKPGMKGDKVKRLSVFAFKAGTFSFNSFAHMRFQI